MKLQFDVQLVIEYNKWLGRYGLYTKVWGLKYQYFIGLKREK